jgi:ankyrin repeat protein
MIRGAVIALASLTLVTGSGAQAQFSDSYNFLKAVKDADGTAATKALDKGSSIVNTRDYGTGETALHITIKRRDITWTRFMLGKGANTNVKDQAGVTPLLAATLVGFVEGAELLLDVGAQVDLANNNGETPLIIATQQRNLPMVRLLLTNGADPKKADRITGKSALDYAGEDARSATVLKLLQDVQAAKPKPKKAGPGL